MRPQSLLIFGMGYTALHIAARLRALGWQVSGTSQAGVAGTLRFDDRNAVCAAMAQASHILSSVPATAAGDPVLLMYGQALAHAPARWIGYLSSVGVYGNTGGAWVDERALLHAGRRLTRRNADLAWQCLREDAWIFRLPGIYGAGRSALDRVRQGSGFRVDCAGQVFNRIHVEDIASAVITSFQTDAKPGVYNVTDDLPCSHNDVIDYAACLLGTARPPLISLDDPRLSSQARAFYSAQRRVANAKIKRLLGWQPLYSNYREGLQALMRS